MDAEVYALIGTVLFLLVVASGVATYLRYRSDLGVDIGLVASFQQRLVAWWMLFAAIAGAILVGKGTAIFLFALLAFWALREFITLTPTRPGDHRALFLAFFLLTPAQFIAVGYGAYRWYSVLLPAFGFLLIPARIVLAGDPKRFLERTAKIQAGLLFCVYSLSYAPALLTLRIPAPSVELPTTQALDTSETKHAVVESQEAVSSNALVNDESQDANTQATAPSRTLDVAANVKLLLFFVLLVQLNDVLQYAWSQLPSQHPIAPAINPTRTWEGFAAGTVSTVLVGTALWFFTPFPHWWQASLAALSIAVMGAAGSLTMSAIKRDRGVRDYSTLVQGHTGLLDRIDSMCFAAPVFFHLVVFMLGPQVI